MNAKNCYGNVEVNQAFKLLITSWEQWSIGKTLRCEIKQIFVCVRAEWGRESARAREFVHVAVFMMSFVLHILVAFNFRTLPLIIGNQLTKKFPTECVSPTSFQCMQHHRVMQLYAKGTRVNLRKFIFPPPLHALFQCSMLQSCLHVSSLVCLLVRRLLTGPLHHSAREEQFTHKVALSPINNIQVGLLLSEKLTGVWYFFSFPPFFFFSTATSG